MPPIKITPAQIKRIKALQGRAGMADEDYRDMLWRLAKVKTCKDLKGAQVDLVMQHLERCAGEPPSPQPSPPGERGVKGTQAGSLCHRTPAPPMAPQATAAQLQEIRNLWVRVSTADHWHREKALCQFIRKRFGVGAPEWLTLMQARKVIEGLKQMARRAAARSNL